jgi:flagellar hook-basal body complex protein FliE
MYDPIRVQPVVMSEKIDIVAQKKPENKRRNSPPFSEVLKASISRVNDMQTDADKMVQRLALGEVEDVSEVSIAVEKAELALRLMVQIRDKLLDAYQQIGRMSV